MLNIGKQFVFDSAHFIPGHPTCGHMHGHTWTLTVELLNCRLDERGVVIDFHDFSDAVRGVLKQYDHKVINDVLVYESIISAETFASILTQEIHDELQTEVYPVPKYGSIKCRLQEGQGGWAEFQLEVQHA